MDEQGQLPRDGSNIMSQSVKCSVKDIEVRQQRIHSG